MSLKLDRLTQAGAPAECMQAVRHAIAPLAVDAKDMTASEQAGRDFNTAHEAVLREATDANVDPAVRAPLAGLLSELQQIRAALQAVRDDNSRRSIDRNRA